MELRHLRYFVAVAEEENISRAARRLHVSQPPLSRQIRDLEDELGVPLLERSAKSVRLTGAGRKFLSEARAVLERADDAVKAARAAGAAQAQDLHVGYAPSPTIEVLPGLVRSFEKAAPSVRVVLHDMTSAEMVAGLRSGKLQAALIVDHPTLRSPKFKAVRIRSYRIGVALSKDHRLARKSAVAFADVASEPIVAYSREEYPDYHDWLGRLFGAKSRKLQIKVECDGAMSLIAAIEAGRGIAIASEATRAIGGSRIRFVPLKPAPPPLNLAIYYPAKGLSPAAQTFAETATRCIGH